MANSIEDVVRYKAGRPRRRTVMIGFDLESIDRKELRWKVVYFKVKSSIWNRQHKLRGQEEPKSRAKELN